MFKNALLASVLGLSVYALATNAAAGHRPEGWYAAIEGGANWIDDGDITRMPIPAPVGSEVEFESGWVALVEVGHRWHNNWRLELELGWRENDIDCVHFPGPACLVGNFGDIEQFTQMINVLHDIDLTPRTTLSIGVGAGGNFVDSDAPGLRDDDDYVFAGQAIVQLTHELSERLEFILTYRYMHSNDPEFSTFGPPTVVEFENENHTVTVGLRFDLQADAAPMAPVTRAEPPPPPAEPRQFIVFFGFNKSHLTKEARAVVEEAAEAAIRGGFVTILVTGHTDTVGSARYNQMLSERRAGVVKRALVNQGINPSAITAEGRGETVLMVQTGDREMEARNRRATIDIN